MPYIDKEKRQYLNNRDHFAKTPGELNYRITQQITEFLTYHQVSYQVINDVVGAIESAKLEFYRRVAAPYEDKKIAENGDVYK